LDNKSSAMNASLNYIIEANIGLILFLATYMLLLKNETDFRMQRMFLLASVLMSLALPLFHLNFGKTSFPTLSQLLPVHLLPEITITEARINPSEPATTQAIINFWVLVQWIYFLGLGFFLLRFVTWIARLMKLINSNAGYPEGKFKIVEPDGVLPTFSFFNTIVVGQAHSLSVQEKQKIIAHEGVHAKQLHSSDILLLNIIGIFFWFNPFLKTYKKIFVQLHEFEADARAVENRDVNEYCSLLAKVALESAGFKLANHFNNSLTLKRIEMMRTIKRKIKPWKMLAIAGVIPIAFFIIACQDQLANEVAEIAQGSTMAIDIPTEVQAVYDNLKAANPDKQYLLMETDENMKPKLDIIMKKFQILDQSQIGHIELITPTVNPSEDIRTFAIIEYNETTEGIADQSKLNDDVYTVVEETAVPEGGMSAFYNHVAHNLNYPAQARRMGIEGKVFVEFVVQTDGTITDVKVKKGIGAGCDAEAVEVIKS
jgi:hypothetical protein